MSLPVLCEGLAPRVIHWYILSIYWSRDHNPCVLLPHGYPTQQTKESCLFVLSGWFDEYFILSCKVEWLQEKDWENIYPRKNSNTVHRMISWERGHVNPSAWAREQVEPPFSSHCHFAEESSASYHLCGGQSYSYASNPLWSEIMCVSFKGALPPIAVVDLHLQGYLGHRHNGRVKRSTETWKCRKRVRKIEKTKKKEKRKKKHSMEKVKKLKMKDPPRNIVQNTSSLVYDSWMLIKTPDVMYL